MIELDLADDAAQSAIGETVTAGLTLDWERGGPLNLPALRVAGAAYSLDGVATARFGDNGVDVTGDFEIAASDLSVFSAIAGHPLTGALTASLSGKIAPLAGLIDVTLTGRGEDLSVGIPEVDPLIAGATDLDLAFRRDVMGTYLDRFTTRSDAAEMIGAARLESGGGEGDVKATIRDAAQILPGLSGPLVLEAATTGAGNIWDLDVQVAGEGLSTDANVVIDASRTVPYLSGTLSLDAADIAPFGPLARRDIAGAVSLSAQGGGARDLSALDITLTGGTEDLRIGIAQADALLGGAASIELAAVGQERIITLRRFQITAPDVELSGQGMIGVDGRTDLDVSARLPRPEFVAPGLPGPLNLTARTRGGPEVLDVTAGLQSPDASAEVDVAIDISGAAPRVEGNASIDVADLTSFSDLAGRTLGGAVNITAHGILAFDLSELDLALDGSLNDLKTGIAQVDGALAGRTVIDVALQRSGDSLSAPRLSIRNAAFSLTGGGTLSREQEGSAEINLTILDPNVLISGVPGPVALAARDSTSSVGGRDDARGVVACRFGDRQ